jgi:hypothetical protein
MGQLKPLSAEAKSDAEIASFELLNEDAQSILEAGNKLPPEVEKKGEEKIAVTDRLLIRGLF